MTADVALVVEDASILESNVGIAEREGCVLDGYRGIRVPAPGIQPGLPFRLRWGAVNYLK